MPKKRIIFTLLYNEGMFSLSRNFRLQKVGNIHWIIKNYDFSNISFCIDELLILNVSRSQGYSNKFLEDIELLSKEIFIPIAIGGGVRTIEDARKIFASGADKVVINTLMDSDQDVIHKIALEFGEQSIVISVDVKNESGPSFSVWHNNGEKCSNLNLCSFLRRLSSMPIGEIYLNSIDNDGTGNGYCIDLLGSIPDHLTMPVILSGGVGNYRHFIDGLKSKKVDAVATAHLFNFIGDGLCDSRLRLIQYGFDFPKWDVAQKKNLRNCLADLV